jgi:endonuclease/exonuclease/phosphatase family metal-dependent hydrolase
MEPMKQLEIGSLVTTPDSFAVPDTVRIVTWNINRGLRLDEVIAFLREAAADLILLQEVDWNARRTHCRNVPREIARALAMNYVFGCEFEELSQRHNPLPAYHGQATLSRFPLLNSRILRFRRQSRFWLPRWFIPNIKPFQRRVGGRMALISFVEFQGRSFIFYNVHLESRGDDGMRCSQLGELLDDISQQPADTQVIVAGDFNADLCEEPLVSAVGNAGLSNPFTRFSSLPTTVPSRLRGSCAIDWILTKGPLVASEAMSHDSSRASDHYPLSLILSSRPYDMWRGRKDE